mmetsp:Transcript_109092/g.309205  ORF Transcript_109092/g.309205 Transcript_109092/m.309205 type:complete len:256 (-) Transcript_109092:889-1656(-)
MGVKAGAFGDSTGVCIGLGIGLQAAEQDGLGELQAEGLSGANCWRETLRPEPLAASLCVSFCAHSARTSSRRLGRSTLVAVFVLIQPASRRSRTSRRRHLTRLLRLGSKVRPRTCQKTSTSCAWSSQPWMSKNGPMTVRSVQSDSRAMLLRGCLRSISVQVKSSGAKSMSRMKSSPMNFAFPMARLRCCARASCTASGPSESSASGSGCRDSRKSSQHWFSRALPRKHPPSPKLTTRHAQRSAYMPAKLCCTEAS